MVEPATIHTCTGRRLSVGNLTLEEAVPIGRVVLRITARRAEHGQVWASLTPAEARGLADALLAQAAEVERRCQARGVGGE
jgi:putative redox protein